MEQPEAPEDRQGLARGISLAFLAVAALALALAALLASLRLAGAIAWPWRWCLYPLRIGLYAFVAAAGGAAVATVITDFFRQNGSTHDRD